MDASRDDRDPQVSRLEAEVRRLRAQNRLLVEDLDNSESGNRVYRRLIGRQLLEIDALKQTVEDLQRTLHSLHDDTESRDHH